MTTTRQSLLECAGKGDAESWHRLVSIYQPMISCWLTQRSIPVHCAEEIGQEVMMVVMEKLPGFNHTGNIGAFRCWLRNVTANQIRAYARKNFNHPIAVGGSEFLDQVENLRDNTSEISRRWDRDHDSHVIRALLEQVSSHFDSKSVEIFRLLVLEEMDVQQIASSFDISAGAIYSIKSRIMRRIRKLGHDLIDESLL